MNLTGPSTEPIGTLHWTGMGRVSVPFVQKTCVRSARYDVNHCSAEPQTSNLRCSTVSRVAWSTVSNTALKSNRTKAAVCFSSTAWTRSLCTQMAAVLVEWLQWYDDWWTGNSWLTSARVTNNLALYQFGKKGKIRYWPEGTEVVRIECSKSG